MKKALYFKYLSEKRVECILCPHHCKLLPGKKGICLTRENHDGVLYTTNYCKPVSMTIDPIEKKPLYHFYPGSTVFSTGPNGCTFKCSFCQNWEISQDILSTQEIPLHKLIQKITYSKTKGVAYTYSEPYIWFETIKDIAEQIKECGLISVMVTNGFMEVVPRDEIISCIDAMNIDIKSMNPDFYKKLCKGRLKPVLQTCEAVAKHCHLEITNLLIPGENDTEKDIIQLVDYIATHLGKEVPLHLSRYFPRYKMDTQATPEISMQTAWEIAKDTLEYVYVGNMYTDDKSNTYCPSCKCLLITRNGYTISIHDTLVQGLDGKCTCKKCGYSLYIKFKI